MGVVQLALPTEDKVSYSYRILVVDDNEACAKTMMWMMEGLGHTAQIALDGYTAIDLAKTFLPNVVLLDIGLPGMNGYEICQAMKKQPALKDTIFIAQTGWGQKEHRERTKEVGFDYHLVKPVDIKALENILLLLGEKNRLESCMRNSAREFRGKSCTLFFS